MVASAATGADFRGVDWGAGKAEVRAVETHALHHDIEDELAYWGFELAGVAAGLVYEFDDDRLARARFVSRNPTGDPRAHLADYRTWRQWTREHFESEGSEEWVDAADRPVDVPLDPIAALTAGTAKLRTRWQRETSAVTLLIAGRDGEVRTVRLIFEPR